MPGREEVYFEVADYDLSGTLNSGQVFRWQHSEGWRKGVIGDRWVALRQENNCISARASTPVANWAWLRGYLQLDVSLDTVISCFPEDPVLDKSVAACRGLRLLKQDPWECLASFILSSTKQIVQIQRIVSLLCARFGSPLIVPFGEPPAFSFPSADQLAAANERELRGCRMGFRAPYLLETAKQIASGQTRLDDVGRMPIEQARSTLMQLPGVGRKIADCALLFGFGFQEAFPVDVWVLRALTDLYFPRRRIERARLRVFADNHFGPRAGYAQQYLFHYMRITRPRKTRSKSDE